jgi:hypothetical protein
MNWAFIIDFLIEIGYLLLVFGVLFGYAIFKGRQAIMNLILGLYIALLISVEFPYYDFILQSLESQQSIAIMKLAFFGLVTGLSTLLFFRIMPDEFRENRFESMGKKILLTLAATVLVMIFSFHVLPVTEFLTPGTPIQSLFAPAEFFFWWLLVPLVALYIV